MNIRRVLGNDILLHRGHAKAGIVEGSVPAETGPQSTASKGTVSAQMQGIIDTSLEVT